MGLSSKAERVCSCLAGSALDKVQHTGLKEGDEGRHGVGFAQRLRGSLAGRQARHHSCRALHQRLQRTAALAHSTAACSVLTRALGYISLAVWANRNVMFGRGCVSSHGRAPTANSMLCKDHALV